MKTALDKLIEKLEDDGYRFDKDIIDEARADFKQQIIKAYKQGAYNYNGRQSEDYFNETFKNGN